MTDQIEQILLPTENVSEVKKGHQHIVRKAFMARLSFDQDES